jgi:hypothetical protein
MTYREIIDKAKKHLDEGFNQFSDREIESSQKKIFLVASYVRAIRLTDAIIILCEKGYTNESIPLLRSLIETAVNMRWVMNKDTDKRLEEYFSALQKEEFGGWWTSTNLKDRMKEIGFPNDYYCMVVNYCHDQTHGNARVLPYHYLTKSSLQKPFSKEAIYSITAQMLGHIIKALDDGYPEKFPWYKDVWKLIEERQKPKEI